MEYHLRISTTKTNALTVLNAFCASFKPVEIVSAFEHKGTREDGTIINPHIHAYLKYNKEPTKQAISLFFKKQANLILKPTNETAGYSHKKQTTSKEQNIIYTIKDGDIIMNTIGDEIINYKEKTEIINESKKQSSRDKIISAWQIKYGNKYPDSKFNIFKFIDEMYVLEWKKSPLAYGHKVSYGIYLLMNIHNSTDNKDNLKYNKLLHSLYNINDIETQYEQNMDLFNKPIKSINISHLYNINKEEYKDDGILLNFDN